MAMLKRLVAIAPPPQWVRVVGGFTEHQFAEKRPPTIDELNVSAPDTPVFILHLYDRAIPAVVGRMQGDSIPSRGTASSEQTYSMILRNPCGVIHL
jgi:Amidohydrolase family